MWCACVPSCKGKLGLFKSANSGSATKTLEPSCFFFLLAVSTVFLFSGERHHVDSHFDATLKGV